MVTPINIYLEGLNEAHNLEAGEYYFDSVTHTMYVGVGDFNGGGGGITPVGTMFITSNGTYDVRLFANATVDVRPDVSGTLVITQNGTYDVSSKASVVVNVNAVVSGTEVITANGTYNIADKEYVEVNVYIPDYGNMFRAVVPDMHLVTNTALNVVIPLSTIVNDLGLVTNTELNIVEPLSTITDNLGLVTNTTLTVTEVIPAT